jgi:RNA polymerase sigma factor (sigma-70 family)
VARRQLGNVIRFLRRTSVSMEGGELTDRQLLARFAGGQDEAAFASLVKRHDSMVWSACRRVLGDGPDAEDAFQAAFLVLAQKAGSMSWQESVGSWLYEVAVRVAMRARRDTSRRRQRERQVPDMPQAEALPQDGSPELRDVLDEELTRLPEKYRAPLVLCYLEGKTNDEAARHLGWPKGTVAIRLSRARDVLRGRLTRRGLAMSAGLALAAPGKEALAAVPASLVTITIQAAVGGAVTAPVAALVKEVVQAMFWRKIKNCMLVVLVLGSIGLGVSGLLYQASAQGVAGRPEQKAPDQPAKAEAGPTVKGLQLTLSLDPDRTTLLKDGSNIEPVKLKLSFGNANQEAMKVNNWMLGSGRSLKFEITGPDGKPLPMKAGGKEVANGSYMPTVMLALPPFFKPVEIKAGKSAPHEEAFPWKAGPVNHAGYFFDKPGDYRIKVVYGNLRSDGPFAGCWSGSVTSNEAVLKVLAADGK